MEQLDYFDVGSGRVCKLLQSLYGLRQAPRIWYKMFDKYLRKCGFNDLLIVGTEVNIEMVLTELKKGFKIKALGEVKHLLGMEITYVLGTTLTISEKGYCEKVLQKCKIDKCKPVPTPQVKDNFPIPGNPEVEAVCVNDDPAVDYRPVVGSLTLSKFLNCYTHEHNVLAKRALRYLRGTSDFGLVWTMAAKPEMRFTAYVNAWRPLKKEIKIMAYADADLRNGKDDQ
ncbi:Transposable element [Phytophthora megakarya]|uniref:Transposable element n=1 Tax=Phytophthora megakarya TaxID=4795 RepID=A0A225VDM5_9STRA|nr:Transposable element [Phytophthora megakarya]